MSLKDRMALGVNFFSVLKSARKVMSNPEFEPLTQKEIAEKILEEITEKNLPQLVEEGIDLESVLDWIVKILPIVLQILVIFI